MIDFEMSIENGFIKYNQETNEIFIENNTDRVRIPADELIKFTETNFWKYISKQLTKK